MALSLAEKIKNFRALHERPGTFIIPNPWDVGTARVLASLGIEAVATTSAGYAFSLGLPDGALSLEQMLAHCAHIAAATDLPVSADLENGFADDPAGVAETIRAAAQTGLAGCSIEDFSGDFAEPIYAFEHAVERIAAAVQAARALPNDFVLTARSENFLRGRPDLDDTIRRLQAFEAAGADVLYAPGLKSLDDIRTLCSAVSRPVNVLMGLPGIGMAELADAGAKRISVGSAFSRLSFGALARAVHEITEQGSFTFSNDAMGSGELEEIFGKYSD